MRQSITVKAWCERYLTERGTGWSDITRKSYHYLVRCHIVPGIGEIALEQLTSQRIPQNPAKSCVVPQPEPLPDIPLRLGQIQRYLIVAEKQDILPLVYVGLTSGLRQKELLSLKWSDFDGQGRIHKGKRLLTVGLKAMRLLHEEYSRHQKILKLARLHPISFRELASNCKGVEL